MRPIVCGIDRSENSQRAAETAAALATALGADTVGVLAYDDVRRFPYGDLEERERKRYAAHRHAESVLRDIRLLSRMERVARRGDPLEVLNAVAAERDAALIALGSRGSGPLRAALLGSVSPAVIRAAERPVLVVPPSAGDHPLLAGAPIVCAVDGSPESIRGATAARSLAESLGIRALAVHADTFLPIAAGMSAPVPTVSHAGASERARDAVEDRLEDALGGMPIRHVQAGPTAAPAIADAAASAGAAILVVGHSGHGLSASARSRSSSPGRRRCPCSSCLPRRTRAAWAHTRELHEARGDGR